MKIRRFILVAMCCVGVCAAARAAEPAKLQRQVVVRGQGKVSAVPDLAKLRVEVSEEGDRVETVSQEVRRKMEAVLKTLKAQGIADKDLQTQFYRVTPKTSWKNNRSQRDGFTVSNQVAVTIHDLKKTGVVLAAVLDAGANTISGPDFQFENPQELDHKALALALQEAKTKAALLVQTAGAELGEVLSIEEGAVSHPGPRPYMAMNRMMAAEAVPASEPVQAGEQTVEATVTATFALK